MWLGKNLEKVKVVWNFTFLEANSDDEYGVGFRDDELEIRFADRLKNSRGFVIKEVKGDGACMFRAVGTFLLIWKEI